MFGSSFGFRLSTDHPISFIHWFQDTFIMFMLDKVNGAHSVGLLCYFVWYIWKHRNKCVFEGISPDPQFVLSLANEAHSEFLMDSSFLTKLVTGSQILFASIPSSTRWSPPIQGFLNINCDGAFNSSSKQGAVGFIARDWQGQSVWFRFVTLLGDDAITIEGQAVYHALLTARRMGFDNIIVETDCANLHKSIFNPAMKYNWCLEALLHDIHHLHLCFPLIEERWIPDNIGNNPSPVNRRI